MLPKNFRLKRDKDFKRAWRKGKSFFTDKIGIKKIKNDLENSRFGFIISNKTIKKASQRNKFKRRLREIIRKNLEKISKGYDFLIIAREGIEKLKFKEMEGKIKFLFKI